MHVYTDQGVLITGLYVENNYGIWMISSYCKVTERKTSQLPVVGRLR